MMAEEARKAHLGRGLSALLGDAEMPTRTQPSADHSGGRTIPIEALKPGQNQPRQKFDQEELKELADSIREKGILQPILVRPTGDAEVPFEIIAGERRWRAAQLAQIHELPVIVRELNDGEALELALIENLQREDLSALEEAEGYRQLMNEFDNTQELLAQSLGKSRSHVANMLRLLKLPDQVKDLMNSGKLSAGHGRAMLNAEDPVNLADQVVRRGLNVRQTEKLAQSGAKPKKRDANPKDINTITLENDVSALLGLSVNINFKGRGGNITIGYDSLEQLDEILHRLSQGAHGRPITPPGDRHIDALPEKLEDALSHVEGRAAFGEEAAPSPGQPKPNLVIATEEAGPLADD